MNFDTYLRNLAAIGATDGRSTDAACDIWAAVRQAQVGASFERQYIRTASGGTWTTVPVAQAAPRTDPFGMNQREYKDWLVANGGVR